MALIYKILPGAQWAEAQGQGAFRGSGVDLADGFIHFSSAHQVRETASRHFAGQPNLMLLAVEADDLSPRLKWEASRGGDLFPHLYGDLQLGFVRNAWPLPLADGRHIFPSGIP